VSFWASPPARSSNQTWALEPDSPREATNDRYRPSGLKRGELSLSGVKVNWMVRLPSQLTM